MLSGLLLSQMSNVLHIRHTPSTKRNRLSNTLLIRSINLKINNCTNTRRNNQSDNTMRLPCEK